MFPSLLIDPGKELKNAIKMVEALNQTRKRISEKLKLANTLPVHVA